MYIIKEVEIKGFWNKHSIKAKLNPDVNIFIGSNGSGKTTFINIIQSVLTLNLEMLSNLVFSSVKITMVNKGNLKKIKVTKEAIDNNYFVIYEIEEYIFKIPLIVADYNFKIQNKNFISKEHIDLNEKLKKIANLIWLPVSRGAYDNGFDRPYSREIITNYDLINNRLISLLEKFTSFRLGLESKVKHFSTNFQKKVLTTMLFDENIDVLNVEVFGKGKTDFSSEKSGLYSAFQSLTNFDDEVKNKIDKHIEAIQKSYDKYKNNELTVDDVFPISLLARTEHIVKLSIELEEKKNEIYEPLKKFLEILSEFIKDKRFFAESNKFTILKNNNVLKIEQLSSGEKQLLILLIENLLQINKNCMFITDEPELSLHIDWQEKLLPSIRKINDSSQIIVATHSPEIASNYPDKLVYMEDILHG